MGALPDHIPSQKPTGPSRGPESLNVQVLSLPPIHSLSAFLTL